METAVIDKEQYIKATFFLRRSLLHRLLWSYCCSVPLQPSEFLVPLAFLRGSLPDVVEMW